MGVGDGKFDEQGSAVITVDGEAAVESADAFAHTAKTVAFLLDGVAAVVFDREGVIVVSRDGEAHGAACGFGVADDVGDGFANGECEDGLFGCAEGGRACGRGFPGERYVGRVEGLAGTVEFCGEALGAVAADGFADFGEGSAGGGFYVGDFVRGALRVVVHQAAGEFGLEDDDGESVSEDVVEIAGDAFALGDGCELNIFFLGGAELAVHALLTGDEDVAAADHRASGRSFRRC